MEKRGGGKDILLRYSGCDDYDRVTETRLVPVRTSYFLMRRVDDCIKLLCETGRIPEAAFLARTYLPSHVSEIVKLWRQDLQTINEKAAESLADPAEYENLFPEFELALRAEAYFNQVNTKIPASKYPAVREDLDRDLIEEIKSIDVSAIPKPKSAATSTNGTASQPPATTTPVKPTQTPTPTPVVAQTSQPMTTQPPVLTEAKPSPQSTPIKTNLLGSTDFSSSQSSTSAPPSKNLLDDDEDYAKFDDDEDDFGLNDKKTSPPKASGKSLVDFDDLEDVEDRLLNDE